MCTILSIFHIYLIFGVCVKKREAIVSGFWTTSLFFNLLNAKNGELGRFFLNTNVFSYHSLPDVHQDKRYIYLWICLCQHYNSAINHMIKELLWTSYAVTNRMFSYFYETTAFKEVWERGKLVIHAKPGIHIRPPV